jgi:hypothetical protein
MELTRELENTEPDGALFDLLAGLDLDTLSDDERVTVTILARKIKAFADYVELTVLRGVEDTAELAMAITEPEQTVARRQELTEDLRTLPRLVDQLREGRLDLGRLEAVRDRVRNLPSVQLITQVEDTLVDIAPGLTHSQLGPADHRAGRPSRPHRLRTTPPESHNRPPGRDPPLPDGMAHLTAILPAVEARMGPRPAVRRHQSPPHRRPHHRPKTRRRLHGPLPRPGHRALRPGPRHHLPRR